VHGGRYVRGMIECMVGGMLGLRVVSPFYFSIAECNCETVLVLKSPSAADYTAMATYQQI